MVVGSPSDKERFKQYYLMRESDRTWTWLDRNSELSHKMEDTDIFADLEEVVNFDSLYLVIDSNAISVRSRRNNIYILTDLDGLRNAARFKAASVKKIGVFLRNMTGVIFNDGEEVISQSLTELMGGTSRNPEMTKLSLK